MHLLNAVGKRQIAFDEQKKQEEDSRLKLTKRLTRQYLENIAESPSAVV
ncbi:MAG: hypothetical protein V4695_06925 [Pseudomonadota bacterium]